MLLAAVLCTPMFRATPCRGSPIGESTSPDGTWEAPKLTSFQTVLLTVIAVTQTHEVQKNKNIQYFARLKTLQSLNILAAN